MAKVVCNITIITSSHISCVYFTNKFCCLRSIFYFFDDFELSLLNWNWTYSQCIHIFRVPNSRINSAIWGLVNLLLFRWLSFWMFRLFLWNWTLTDWNWTYSYSVFTNFHVEFLNHNKTLHLKSHSQNLCKHFATFLAFSIKFWLKRNAKRKQLREAILA